MRGWNSFSNDWSRMQLRMNHTLWENGIGRGRPATINAFASVEKRKKKKFKNGIPEGLENDGRQSGSEVWDSDSGEWVLRKNQSESQPQDMTGMESSSMDSPDGMKSKENTRGKKKKRKKRQEENSGQQQTDVKGNMQDMKKNCLEQRSAAMQSGKKQTGKVAGAGLQVKEPTSLQEAILWAEILGEPVSVRRRKKRVNQCYGNQGNAYRR